jgi:hypothetical protein
MIPTNKKTTPMASQVKTLKKEEMPSRTGLGFFFFGAAEGTGLD